MEKCRDSTGGGRQLERHRAASAGPAHAKQTATPLFCTISESRVRARRFAEEGRTISRKHFFTELSTMDWLRGESSDFTKKSHAQFRSHCGQGWHLCPAGAMFRMGQPTDRQSVAVRRARHLVPAKTAVSCTDARRSMQSARAAVGTPKSSSSEMTAQGTVPSGT